MPPSPTEIEAAVRKSGLSAMPAIWSALGLPSTLHDADARMAAALGTRDSASCAQDPCVRVFDGGSIFPPSPLVLVGINVVGAQLTLLQLLVFRVADGRSRFIGHAEFRSFDYDDAPVMRLERIGRYTWPVIVVVDHPWMGALSQREKWLDTGNDGGGTMTVSFDRLTKGVSLQYRGAMHDQQFEGRLAWTGERGQPAIDVDVRHEYVDINDGSDDAWKPFFTQTGMMSYRWAPATRRFAFDPGRSDLTAEKAEFQCDAKSILQSAFPSLLRMAHSGTDKERAALTALLTECASDQTCAALSEGNALRAALGARSTNAAP